MLYLKKYKENKKENNVPRDYLTRITTVSSAPIFSV